MITKSNSPRVKPPYVISKVEWKSSEVSKRGWREGVGDKLFETSEKFNDVQCAELGLAISVT